MDAIVVTVGRNVVGVPMDDSTWEDFQDAIEHALYTVYNPTVYFAGTGTGYSAEWGTEEAYTVVAASPRAADFGGDAFSHALLLALARVGRSYGQEAVAVTEGPTQFV